MEAEKQMYVITAGDSAAIVPTAERAGETVKTWLASGQAKLHIVMRPAEQCAAVMGLTVGDVRKVELKKQVRARLDVVKKKRADATAKPVKNDSGQAGMTKKKKASRRVRAQDSGDIQQRVLDAIKGGADTCTKIAKQAGISGVTAGSYVKKLAAAGLVTVTGAFSSFKVVPAGTGKDKSAAAALLCKKVASILCRLQDKQIPATECKPVADNAVCSACRYNF